MTKISLVIPTIRNLDFLKAWQKQFLSLDPARISLTLIICEDHPQPTIKIPNLKKFEQIPALKKIEHYSWQEIDQDLGKNSWIIPRKVSGIRNYGFIKAYQQKADVIITIDDDCYPVKGHNLILDHLANLKLTIPKHWTNSYPDKRHLYTRGIPYLVRNDKPVMLSHGLWTNVLDHDGPTHLQNLNFKAEFAQHFLQIIPEGCFYPMCSMNIAFKREITPLMYFSLMGEDPTGNKWGYDRFDDIWAGIFAKKVMDHLELGVVNGAPFVEHRKASDPFKNLQKEAKGIETNEQLWREVNKYQFKNKNLSQNYVALINSLNIKEKYFDKLKEAAKVWVKVLGG